MPSFEEVFSKVLGRFGRYGRWAGRGIVIASTVGLVVGWLGCEPCAVAQLIVQLCTPSYLQS